MEKAARILGDRYARNSFVWCGKDRAAMHYPIDRGELCNVIVVNSAVPLWEGPWVRPVKRDQTEAEFAGWGEHVQKIISMLDPNESSAWSIWDHPPAPFYAKGKVALMDDAAHSATPFQGQEAGQAIEDALVLTEVLGEVRNPADLTSAFRAYDKIRRPVSQRNVKSSREAGKAVTFRLPDIGDSKEALQDDLEWRFDWLWHRDIPSECNEAKILLRKLQKGQSIDRVE